MNILSKVLSIHQAYGILGLIKIIVGKINKEFNLFLPFYRYQWAQKSVLKKPEKNIYISINNNPLVSVIIPVYNNSLYTYNCLKAIATNTNCVNIAEIIVINDKSTDNTEEILQLGSGIKIVNNLENQGFIYSCNKGASIAKGKYLCFLNNDTKVLNGWLDNLVEVLKNDSNAGAVGSKLIYPNGQLQEAGGIIWNDGRGCNYGRGEYPNAPEYNYLREVDYCSGACLLVRSDLFKQLNGFSQEFLPAYYEDTDLCFSIRQLGYKVMYQPKSEVIHYEGITSGTDLKTGVKSYQLINQEKFRTKWEQQLEKHYSPSPENIYKASKRLIKNQTILIIDSYVPLYDKESGSLRLFNLIKIFLKLGYSIIFVPDDARREEPYTSELQNLGVEVLYCGYEGGMSLIKQLIKRLDYIDFVWVCRPNLAEKYIDIIKHKSKAIVIYDTVDLHFVRFKRELENASQKSKYAFQWHKYKQLELNLARSSTATIVVTKIEKEVLHNEGISNVFCVPNIVPIDKHQASPFEKREGLLFIGSYLHSPNVDAVTWLCEEIMPLIWTNYPDISVTLLGSNPPKQVKKLAEYNTKIFVTGYIKDVNPYFLTHKVFVSPLRFGAGMKGKINQSLSFGLPTVTTSIGAEGMDLVDQENVLIANSTEEFVKSILRLYNSSQMWNLISSNALKLAQKYTPSSVSQSIEEIFLNLKNNL